MFMRIEIIWNDIYIYSLYYFNIMAKIIEIIQLFYIIILTNFTIIKIILKNYMEVLKYRRADL